MQVKLVQDMTTTEIQIFALSVRCIYSKVPPWHVGNNTLQGKECKEAKEKDQQVYPGHTEGCPSHTVRV